MQKLSLKLRAEGKTIAFVPTMGALHKGHLSLVQKASKLGDVVVMSIYVNPTQFGPKEDFSRYPRPFQKDAQLAKQQGVDILFVPEKLYDPDDSTIVEETVLSQGRCGAVREGHFRGVATVVCKLFNIVQPHVAVFGQKDAQQCDVIERMVRDLYLPVKMVRSPIVRTKDGLALSSRNAYLTPSEYQTALNFPKALKEATQTKNLSPKKIEALATQLIRKKVGIAPEYVTWANGHLCAVVKIGSTRLLDNIPYPL